MEQDVTKTFPFQFWKGGQYKWALLMVLYKTYIVKYILFMLTLVMFLVRDPAFLVLLCICIPYVLLGRWLERRTDGEIICEEEAMMLVLSKKKTVIPWSEIKRVYYYCGELTSEAKPVKRGRYNYDVIYRMARSYTLIIEAKQKYYSVHDMYEGIPNVDENGEENMMNIPLHVVYVNLKEEWMSRKESKRNVSTILPYQ